MLALSGAETALSPSHPTTLHHTGKRIIEPTATQIAILGLNSVGSIDGIEVVGSYRLRLHDIVINMNAIINEKAPLQHYNLYRCDKYNLYRCDEIVRSELLSSCRRTGFMPDKGFDLIQHGN